MVHRQLDEQVKLREVLAGHLDMRAGQALKHQLLKKFVDAGSEQIALLLRQEHRPVRAATEISAACVCLAAVLPLTCNVLQG